MGMIRWYHRCAQGSCPSAIYFCLFHHSCTHLIHVNQFFDGDKGKEEKERDEWRRATEEGSKMERLFSFIFIYSENIEGAHIISQ